MRRGVTKEQVERIQKKYENSKSGSPQSNTQDEKRSRQRQIGIHHSLITDSDRFQKLFLEHIPKINTIGVQPLFQLIHYSGRVYPIQIGFIDKQKMGTWYRFNKFHRVWVCPWTPSDPLMTKTA